MKSITSFTLQYAHRFYGFKGEAQSFGAYTIFGQRDSAQRAPLNIR